MDETPNSLNCKSCGSPYILPEEVEDEAQANFPQVLLCGHIFCTACLNSMVELEVENCIVCPDCKVESDLPVEGVAGLEVDPRVVGLIYTTKMNKKRRSVHGSRGRHLRHVRSSPPEKEHNVIAEEPDEQQTRDAMEKIEKAVDEALAQAAENMSRLEHIHQTLMTGRKAQVAREKSRLLMEINEVIEKAKHVLSKRKDALVSDVDNMEAFFVSSNNEVSRVEKRMKDLELAMQKARQVRQCRAMKNYCNLETVLEILQTPVDDQSVDMTCITMGCGLSCVLRADNLSKIVEIHAGEPKPLSEEHAPRQQEASSRKTPWRNPSPPPPWNRELPGSQQNVDQPRRRTQIQSLTPRPKISLALQHHGRTGADTGPDESATPKKALVWPCQDRPDVIVEELIEEEEEEEGAVKEESSRLAGHADVKVSPTSPPLTGTELASNTWRTTGKKKEDTTPTPVKHLTEHQLVQVTHVVSPNHFYLRYWAERKQTILLSRKISDNCCGDRGVFSPRDTIRIGIVVFVKTKEGWSRATVKEIAQRGIQDLVTTCPVTQLCYLRLFLPDYGFFKRLGFDECMSDESALKSVNVQLRRVDEWLRAELRHWAPQAVKCSLKDVIPVDMAGGWTREARFEFRNVLGSAMMEMKLYGHDRDTLLVDLMKSGLDKASNMPTSVRDYLIFIGLARFYTPLQSSTMGPLLFYSCKKPKVGTEYNAMVSHVNSLSDFYIQLVDNMEFLLLSSKLNEFYSSFPQGGDDLQLYCPVPHQACVARYNEGKWYRATIMGHPGGTGRNMEVMFVDFGHKAIVSVSDLRKIKDEFFALPIMAIQCCLSNLVPRDGDNWNETTNKRFVSLTFEKPVTVVATAKASRVKPLPVTLYESSFDGPQTNLNELLIAEELACSSKSVGAEDAEPCAVVPVWDPPLEGLIASEPEESLPSSGSTSDQGSLRDQAQDAVDFQPNLELPACLDMLKVRVTHVDSPGSFYVQLTQNNMLLKRLNEMLKQEYGSMEPQDVQWEADMYVAVLINGLWERGQICDSVASTNMAEVRRCDFGNRVFVHFSNLRPLQDVLVGSLALECALSDIRPAGGRSTWTATACDFISYYVTGAVATMTIKELTEQRPVPVSLSCSSNKTGENVCIADFLVSEGLALKERKQRETYTLKMEDGVSGPKDGGIQKDVPAAAVDDDDFPPLPPSPPASPPPPPPSPPSTSASPQSPSIPVFPPSPSTPASPPSPSTPVFHPSPSTPASLSLSVAVFPSSPATTASPPSPSIPDFYQSPLAPASPQSPLTPASTPPPSIPISPPLPPPPASPAPSSPTLPVVTPRPAPKPAPRTSLAAERVKTTLYQPPELPPLGRIGISISAVGDDGVIYARTYRAACQLEQLKRGIQKHMKTLPKQKPYTWKCVQGCCVMGPDMHWHRGQVLEIISGHVRVRYVDSGHVENIPVVHVYPMLLCEEVPQLCIPCQLHGLIPVGRKWQVDAVALLRNLLVGRVLDMQVMELPLDERGCVTVQIFLDGLNLSRIMCNHQHASVDMTVALQEKHFINSTDRTVDEWDIDTEGLEMPNEPVLGPFSYPILPIQGEHFRVRVKHLCTPNEVFLVPVEEAVLVNGETLEEAMTRVNADIDCLPRLSNYPLGGACLVEYSDGRYYRARMMEFSGVNPPTLMVQHVDFGSDDTVHTSRLRQMPAGLLKFPASALKVRLHGFKPPRVNLESEVLPYSPEWSIKAAQVMIDLLHGKITASVVAREPELTVLLYNENGELVHLPLVHRRLADHEA